MGRLVRLAPALMVCLASAADAAAGRNWQISIDGIACEAAASRVTLETRVRYLGPRGLVEAPVNQLVDGEGRPHPPRGLVWAAGSKSLAAWLSAGGMRNLQAEEAARLQFKYEVREGTEALTLEFGDVKALVLTRKRSSENRGLCAALLKPGEIQAARAPRAARTEDPAPGYRVYRSVYPCRPPGGPLRTVEAQYPPTLPEQLLLFGRGYLPNARQVDLPMGKAGAQAYAYTGTDELDAIENAARRAVQQDFPGLASNLRGGKLYAFNWGAQAAASGNQIYSIGIYTVRPC